MKFNQSKFGRLMTVRNCLIAVCLVLIAMSAMVQVLHFHQAGAVNEARHCPICHVAGATMLALVIALLWFGLSRTAYVALSQTPHLYSAFESFSLFSRPPPLV
jgi:hypothetical protein